MQLFEVSSERLIMIPLDINNLELCIYNFSKMESNLDIAISGKALDEREKTVYKLRLVGAKGNRINYMWNTVWIVILKQLNQVAGTIMIKGYPNEKGEVVIGYSMEEVYRCKGYMTEALNALIKWTFLNPDVKSILADTLKTSIPSHKVLTKVGMTIYKEDNECFWWKLEK